MVLTSLHVISFEPNNQNPNLPKSMANEIIFYPEVEKNINKEELQGIRVIKSVFDHEYFSRISG